MWNEKKDQGKKEERIERLRARTRGIYYTETSNLRFCLLPITENQCYVIYYPVFFTKHRNESLTSSPFPTQYWVLSVTRVIESSISLSYCKLCLIAILPSKCMGFKPTHTNFRVDAISYLTRLYMTLSHFSPVHQTT